VIDDVLAFIHDAEARGLIARFIERVLVFPIDPDVPERPPGDFLQFSAHATPVNAAHDDGKVCAVRLLVNKLGEHFLRAPQAFGFAALPMQGRVGVVEPLDAAPGKGAYFYRFAGHDICAAFACLPLEYRCSMMRKIISSPPFLPTHLPSPAFGVLEDAPNWKAVLR
jgi:hypothetical protein